jgi:hypothetical protein
MPKAKRPKKPAKRPARRAPPKKKPSAKRAKAKAKAPRTPAYKTPRLSPLSGESVDSYVRLLPSPQQVIVNRLRALVASAAPEAMEALKWSVFEAEGPFAHIRAGSNHVSFGFLRGALLEAPPGTLEGDGDMMRHVKISSWKDVKEEILKALVRQAVLLNQRLGDPTRR